MMLHKILMSSDNLCLLSFCLHHDDDIDDNEERERERRGKRQENNIAVNFMLNKQKH